MIQTLNITNKNTTHSPSLQNVSPTGEKKRLKEVSCHTTSNQLRGEKHSAQLPVGSTHQQEDARSTDSHQRLQQRERMTRLHSFNRTHSQATASVMKCAMCRQHTNHVRGKERDEETVKGRENKRRGWPFLHCSHDKLTSKQSAAAHALG